MLTLLLPAVGPDMASSLTWLWEQLPGDPYRTIILTLGAAYILPKALRLSVCKLGALFRSRPEPPPSQRDVVHLCVFPRSYARQHLNLSPFAVKLETWLRLYKIPYKVRLGHSLLEFLVDDRLVYHCFGFGFETICAVCFLLQHDITYQNRIGIGRCSC